MLSKKDTFVEIKKETQTMRKYLVTIPLLTTILILFAACPTKVKENDNSDTLEENSENGWQYNDAYGSITQFIELDNGKVLTIAESGDYYNITLELTLFDKDGNVLTLGSSSATYDRKIHPDRILNKIDTSTYRLYFLETYRYIDTDEYMESEEKENQSRKLFTTFMLRSLLITDNEIENEEALYCSKMFENFQPLTELGNISSTDLRPTMINGKIGFLGSVRVESDIYSYSDIPFIVYWQEEVPFWEQPGMRGNIYPQLQDCEFLEVTTSNNEYSILANKDTLIDSWLWSKQLELQLDKKLELVAKTESKYEEMWRKSPMEQSQFLMDADDKQSYTITYDHNTTFDDFDITIKKIYKADKTEIWSRSFRELSHFDHTQIVKAKNGDLIIPMTKMVYEKGWGEYQQGYLSRLDTEGEVVWTESVKPTRFTSIAELSDGDFMIGGSFGNFTGIKGDWISVPWIQKLVQPKTDN